MRIQGVYGLVLRLCLSLGALVRLASFLGLVGRD